MTQYAGYHRMSQDGAFIRTVPEQDYDVDDSTDEGAVLTALAFELRDALNERVGYERYRFVALDESSS